MSYLNFLNRQIDQTLDLRHVAKEGVTARLQLASDLGSLSQIIIQRPNLHDATVSRLVLLATEITTHHFLYHQNALITKFNTIFH